MSLTDLINCLYSKGVDKWVLGNAETPPNFGVSMW